MSILHDPTHDLIYVPMSRELAHELRRWSNPCQVKIEGDMLVVRDLGQPVKGVYIVSDDSNQDQGRDK